MQEKLCDQVKTSLHLLVLTKIMRIRFAKILNSILADDHQSHPEKRNQIPCVVANKDGIY